MKLLSERLHWETNKCRLRLKKTKLQLFFSLSSNPVVFRSVMSHRAKPLMEFVDNIYDDAQRRDIKSMEGAGDNS